MASPLQTAVSPRLRALLAGVTYGLLFGVFLGWLIWA